MSDRIEVSAHVRRGMAVRRTLIVVGVLLLSGGIISAAWAVVADLSTPVSYGLLVAILGGQAVSIGVALRVVALDWPPLILFKAGVEHGEQRERQKWRRQQMGSVERLADRVAGQS